jgi:outer membrane protein assembly factor BamB
MRPSIRLPRLAMVAITGLALTLPGTAAALAGTAPHRAASPAPLWVTRQDPPRGVQNFQMAASPTGSAVFAVGVTGAFRGVIVALDPATGAALWHDTYTAKRRSWFSAVAVSPDGGTVYVTGKATSDPARSPTGLTVAYNAATGAIRWAESLSRSASPNAAVAVSPDGSAVFVTGDSQTVAYDAATGAKLWYAPGSDSFVAASPGGLAVSPGGSAVFVAGTAYLGPTGHRMAFSTTAYSAGTGARLWHAQYNVVKGNSEAFGLAAGTDGVYVTGFTTLPLTETQQCATVAYDPVTGARLWVRDHGNPKVSNAGFAVAVSPDGSKVFVTGASGDTSSTYDSSMQTLAYDAATGTSLWTARWGDAPGSGGNAGGDVVVSPDGSTVFVAGDRYLPGTAGQPQFATAAYDSATGTRRWAALYGTPGTYNVATSLAVSPDGSKVFVTGESGNDAMTLAYNS